MERLDKAINTISDIYTEYLLSETDIVDIRTYDEALQDVHTLMQLYKDTGLTPEEIEQLKDELNHAYDKSNTAVKGYYELKQSYEQLQKENADLIELLKIMYKDLIGKCSVCVVKDGDMRECFGCNKINSKWQWQHADKLKELGVKV